MGPQNCASVLRLQRRKLQHCASVQHRASVQHCASVLREQRQKKKLEEQRQPTPSRSNATPGQERRDAWCWYTMGRVRAVLAVARGRWRVEGVEYCSPRTARMRTKTIRHT